MRVLSNPLRVVRLMRSAIDDLRVDLTGMRVLTEAASGPFAITPVLAAMAGAEHVIAIGRNSRWGGYREVVDHVESLIKATGCPGVIEFSDRPAVDHAAEVNVVTNLGFVRPIDASLVARLPPDAAVSLMWEPWEFRPGEIDVAACRARGIPVLGTNEGHPRLRIFAYLTSVAVRLLLERDIEVERSRLLLVASEPFGSAMVKGLRKTGAEVMHLDPVEETGWHAVATAMIEGLDAIVLAEHRSAATVIGPGGLPAAALAEAGVEVIHICGGVDEFDLAAAKLTKHPPHSVPHGVMVVTTDYVGPRPVIDLHAAGLAVGADLVRLLRAGKDETVARAMVVAGGLGADFLMAP